MSLLMLLVWREPLAPPPLASSGAPVASIASVAPVAVSARIIDVAPGVQDVTSVVRLAPGERVIAVDGRPVESELVAGAAIAGLPRGRGRYIDLTVAASGELRRVLVVMH